VKLERIEANPTVTLLDILDASNEDGFPNISLATLYRYLDHEVSNEMLPKPSKQEHSGHVIFWSIKSLHMLTVTNLGVISPRHATPLRKGAPIGNLFMVLKDDSIFQQIILSHESGCSRRYWISIRKISG
jgi:hypothetical protein